MRKGNDLLAKMCSLIDEQSWRIDIHPRALEEHHFGDGNSQGVESTASGVQSCTPPGKKTQKGSLKEPLKRGKRMSPERLLKSRPILQDILNGVVG